MRVRLLEKAFGYKANDIVEMSAEMARAVIIRGIAITAGRPTKQKAVTNAVIVNKMVIGGCNK